MNKQLIYVSLENQPFEEQALADLAQRSSEANAGHGITGFLFYRYGVFVQCLEGPCEAIEALSARIAADPRHAIAHQVMVNQEQPREFPDWHMRLFDFRNPTATQIESRLEEQLLNLRSRTDQDSAQLDEILNQVARLARTHTSARTASSRLDP